MSPLRSLTVVFFLFLAAACAEGEAVKTASYTPPANPGGRLCIAQCGTAREYCRQDCDFEVRDCIGQAQSRALQDYDRYTRDQFAARQPVELRPRDFERTGECEDMKKRCANKCENPYQTCYKNCGGKIDIQSSCQFLCF